MTTYTPDPGDPRRDAHRDGQRDILGDALSAAMESRAATVRTAPDALARIEARVHHRSRYRRKLTMSLTSLATGTAATITAVVVGLTSCVPTETVPPGGPTTSSLGATPTTPAPTSTSTTPAAVEVRVPVYAAADERGRIVLYREFRSASVPSDTPLERMRAAVSTMLSTRPLDPDYRSLWPAGASVRGVQLSGDVATVDLAGATTNSVGAEASAVAVQQLVFTVTGVAADRGVTLRGIRLRLDGRQVSELWGHVSVGGVLTRAAALDTLAPVWLISPQEGDTLARTFQVHISGAVPEATVRLRVRDGAGREVTTRTVTLSIGGPARGEAFVTLTLASGRYVLEAFYHSLADGSEQALDDHAITVR